MRALKLALAILALLAGCGTPVKPIETAEAEGDTWRVLDLDDAANAEILAWLVEYPNQAEAEKPAEYKLSDGETLFERKESELIRTIRLRDEATGKETLLVDARRKGKTAYVQEVLSERYFIYYDPATGQIHMYSLALGAAWDTAEALASSENLLDGVPEADMGETKQTLGGFSPDGRYMVIVEYPFSSALRIFDLLEKKFIARVPSGFDHVAFRDARTIYCYNNNLHDRRALEITLP